MLLRILHQGIHVLRYLKFWLACSLGPKGEDCPRSTVLLAETGHSLSLREELCIRTTVLNAMRTDSKVDFANMASALCIATGGN